MMSSIGASCFYMVIAESLSCLSFELDSFCEYWMNPSLEGDGAHIRSCATLAHLISLRLVFLKPCSLWLSEEIRRFLTCRVSAGTIFLSAFEREKSTCH